MAANFPSTQDDSTTLPNPSATNKTNNPDHAALHSNANDAIKAIEAKLGTGATTPSANRVLLGTGSGTSAWQQLTSAELRSVLSDETGSGSAVFSSTPTLTTPKVDTINEETPANGVTIDGLNFKDGKLNTTDSVVTANYTDGSILPEHLVSGSGTSWTWQSWAPSWTGVTVGNGTVTAKYSQTGKSVLFYLRFVLGSTSAISGQPIFSLPVTASSSFATGNVERMYNVHIEDSGTQSYYGRAALNTTTTAICQVINVAGTYASAAAISSTVPMTWTTNDSLSVIGFYEAA